PQAIESPPGELPGRHQVRALALRLRARLSKFHQRPSGTLLATVRTTDKCRNRQTTPSETQGRSPSRTFEPLRERRSGASSLCRLDPAKRRIGVEFGRDNQPARRKDGGQPFAGLHNSACSQDRSFPNAPIDGCTDFPSFDLVVRAIHPHVQCIPLCLERCDLTMEPRYADISFTLAGELLLRNPARRAFHCRHNRTLSVQLRADLFHITLGCEPLALKSLRSAQLGFGIFDSRSRFANPILCLFCTDGGGTLLFKAGFLLVADLRAQSLNFGPQSSSSRLLLAQLQLV